MTAANVVAGTMASQLLAAGELAEVIAPCELAPPMRTCESSAFGTGPHPLANDNADREPSASVSRVRGSGHNLAMLKGASR